MSGAGTLTRRGFSGLVSSMFALPLLSAASTGKLIDLSRLTPEQKLDLYSLFLGGEQTGTNEARFKGEPKIPKFYRPDLAYAFDHSESAINGRIEEFIRGLKRRW